MVNTPKCPQITSFRRMAYSIFGLLLLFLILFWFQEGFNDTSRASLMRKNLNCQLDRKKVQKQIKNSFFNETLQRNNYCQQGWVELNAQSNADLKPFVSGISNQDVNLAWEALGKPIRVVISNGILYHSGKDCNKIHGAVLLILKAHYTCGLPNLDLVINDGDNGRLKRNEFPALSPPPIWSWTKAPSMQLDIWMPYWNSLWLPKKDDLMKAASQTKMEWLNRTSKLVWRGSQTGGRIPNKGWNNDWRVFPRSKLSLICRNITACDAGFYKILPSIQNQSRNEMISEGIIKDRIAMKPILSTTKYGIFIDGNGPPSSRSINEFGRGQLTFIVQDLNKEFWYHLLQPYVHYIPVSNTLEDFASKLQWALDHDDEAYIIAKTAAEFVLEYFNEEHFTPFLAYKLNKYSKLLTYHPSISSISKFIDRDLCQVDLHQKQKDVSYMKAYVDRKWKNLSSTPHPKRR